MKNIKIFEKVKNLFKENNSDYSVDSALDSLNNMDMDDYTGVKKISISSNIKKILSNGVTLVKNTGISIGKKAKGLYENIIGKNLNPLARMKRLDTLKRSCAVLLVGTVLAPSAFAITKSVCNAIYENDNDYSVSDTDFDTEIDPKIDEDIPIKVSGGTPVKEDKETEDTPKREEKGTEDTPKREDKGTEDTPKREDKGTEDTAKREDKGTEDTAKREDKGTEDTPKREDKGTEDTAKREDKGTEDTPKREDKGTEDTPKREDKGTEDTPKRDNTIPEIVDIPFDVSFEEYDELYDYLTKSDKTSNGQDNKTSNKSEVNDDCEIQLGSKITIKDGSKIYDDVYDAGYNSNELDAYFSGDMERTIFGIAFEYEGQVVYCDIHDADAQQKVDYLKANGAKVISIMTSVDGQGYEGAYNINSVSKVLVQDNNKQMIKK